PEEVRLVRGRRPVLNLPVDEALRSTRDLAAQVKGSDAASGRPVVDAALAPGRVTGLTGEDEVSWLRACLMACTRFEGRPGGHRASEVGPPTPAWAGGRASGGSAARGSPWTGLGRTARRPRRELFVTPCLGIAPGRG